MAGDDALARLLTDAMRAAPISQRGLARKLNVNATEDETVTEGTIRNLLRGGRRGRRGLRRETIAVPLLRRVAAALDLPFQDVMDAAVASTEDNAEFSTRQSADGSRSIVLAGGESGPDRGDRAAEIVEDPDAEGDQD